MVFGIVLLLVFYSSYSVIGVIATDDDILSKFTQSDYKIKDIMFEMEYYNKKYINYMETKIFKPTRKIQAINFTINYKVALNDKLEVIVQAYKFLSNQYKTFPVRLHFNACKLLRANVLGINEAFKCGNFTECNFKKDTTYHLCNYIPDISKLPPLIPDGRYMNRIQQIFENQIISSAKAYAEVYRPIYVPNDKK